ncbi:MAG TPA: outer membrane protein assembly factor BamD [Candidatus Acidoferrales bacterium]|nr:outer membrane protein assembly factor BamD [Candidatus Acidoferrales bacterium]
MRPGRTIYLVAFGATLLAGCFGKKSAAPVAGTSAQPDSILYTKATNDIKHGRYSVGRLALQTLINTYPDSEYLAKAKLEIADSYYKEGGNAGLKQSIVECKDFITFFPFLDEAANCQLQIAMAHYRQMEKPDRDHAEAVQAEAEFQTFLEKYPNSSLRPQAEQHLRDVQEVLAEGNFRVASFYYTRTAYRAAGARLIELTNRYPLYSQADQANWMLGQIYEKGEHNEIAARYYSRIVKDYPLSPLAGDAKNKLVKFGVPVPPADPTAVARMQKEQSMSRPGFVKRSMTVLKSNPDVSTAAHNGAPTMTPASESGDETIGFGLQPNANAAPTASVGSTATVETVTPGSPDALPQTPVSAPATDASPATSDPTQPAASSSTDSSTTTAATPANTSQESSSKKKSGLRKLIPF